MAYTTKQASDTFDKYLGVEQHNKNIIENTKKRGFVYKLKSGEEIVIFIYPIVHKQDNTKNFFDTRDSGAYERGIAWRYALEHKMKYFCVGVNEQVEKYNNYVFSLECNENIIEKISGTKDGIRNGSGNQIIIPNDYVPDKNFERITNKLGIYISVIHRDSLIDYLEKYDNRPYMLYQNMDIEKREDDIDEYPCSSRAIEKYIVETGGTLEESVNEKEFERKEREYIPLNFNTKLETKFDRNRIVFGAPGTGKSYKLKEDANELLKNMSSNIERVTFHPDYSYSQFVGAYKPVSDINGDIRYQFVPGPFMRIYVNALKSGRTDNPQPYLLLVEEINRARVAAVFGDVFQLLDRDVNGVSEYQIQSTEDVRKYLAEELGGKPDNYRYIQIPNNMFIWATMNSADQGVFPMDTAFKRRWNFQYIGIDKSEDKVEKYIIPVGMGESRRYIVWNQLRKRINNILIDECKVNEDKLLGPFFISKNMLDTALEDEDKFVEAFESKVIMYLFEDVMKMRPANIFKGHDGKMIFSEICKNFEKNGEEVFGITDIFDVGKPTQE